MNRSSHIAAMAVLVTTLATAGYESIAQGWVQTNGPMGSDVTAIGFHSSGTLFAGTDLRGIFRSIDEGDSWTYAGVADHKLRGFAEDTDGSVLAATFTGGVFRSENLGETWTPMNNGLTDPRVHSIAKSPGGDIIVGTLGAGVFFLDREAGWTPHTDGLLDLDVRAVAFDETGGAYAATFREGVFHWTGGRSPWSRYNGGSELAVIRSIAAGSGIVVAGAWSGGVAYTHPEDTSWTPINEGLPNQRVWQVAVGPDGTLVAGMIANGVYRFDPVTTSWRSIGLPDNIVSALEIKSDGTFWVGTRTGIYRAGSVGEPLLLKGVPKSVVYAVLQTASGAWLAATEQDGIFRSTDEGSAWIPTGLQVRDAFSLAEIGGFVFAGSTFGEIYRSDDDGLTWYLLGRGPDDDRVTDPITSLVPAHNGSIFAGSFGSGILRSNDQGDSWKHAGLVRQEVSGIVAGPNGDLYAATFDGVFVTVDSSGTWSRLGTGLTNALVRAIWADSNGDLTVGTVGDGLYRLPAGSIIWEPFGLDGAIVFSIVRGEDGALYAATYGSGVFRKSGSGEWEPVFRGLSNPFVISLGWMRGAPPARDHYLLAGTDPDGVFRLLVTVTSNTVPGGAATLLTMYPSFPNPFSASTTFAFELDRPTEVRLRVYDVLGREIGAPASGWHPAGRHYVVWTPIQAANGTYVYKLIAGGVSRTGVVTRAR